jgi:hypothetical protein
MRALPSAILVVVIASWIVTGLIAREVLPGSRELTDRLFFAAVPLTWLGLWLFAVVAARATRPMLYRALAANIVAVALLGILELPAALGWMHWTIVFRRLTGEGTDYGTAYVYDADLSFRRIPGLAWTGRPSSDIEQGYGLPRSASEPISFTYDRWGYRNAVEMERAAIVLLGDSYVEGWYVDDAETVASRLAARLDVPIANLGVAGYGTLQELRVLRSDALDRRPQLVVWFFFEGNDLYDDQSFENSRLAEPPSPAETVPHPEGLAAAHGWRERSFTLNALRLLRRWSHPLIPNRAPYWAHRRGETSPRTRIYFADYGAVPWTDFEMERWRTARAAFEEGVALARARDVEVVFVYVPTKYRVYRDALEIPPDSPLAGWSAWTRLPRLFSEFCTSNGVRCLDLTEPFREAVLEGAAIYARTDTHWGPAGHDLAALELARLLGPG